MKYAEINILVSEGILTVDTIVRGITSDQLTDQQQHDLSEMAAICARNNWSGVRVYFDPRII